MDIFNKNVLIRLDLFLKEPYMKRVDIDNVSKTVLDCMSKIVYKDDNQVYVLNVIKHKAEKEEFIIQIAEYTKWIRLRWGKC